MNIKPKRKKLQKLLKGDIKYQLQRQSSFEIAILDNHENLLENNDESVMEQKMDIQNEMIEDIKKIVQKGGNDCH